MRILVVEDEVAISDGICAFLTNSGYNCIQAFNGEQALLKFEQNEIDFVLLDIMLPKKSGLEVLQLIRKQSEVPVLILTALSDDETKIAAFNILADGFINKPFSLAVLAARIEAIYRRRNPVNEGWKYKNLEVDFVNYVATVDGQKIKINPKELEELKVIKIKF